MISDLLWTLETSEKVYFAKSDIYEFPYLRRLHYKCNFRIKDYDLNSLTWAITRLLSSEACRVLLFANIISNFPHEAYK